MYKITQDAFRLLNYPFPITGIWCSPNTNENTSKKTAYEVKDSFLNIYTCT